MVTEAIKVNMFWFRRDLRLEDNTGLYNALQDDLPVLPIFIFDTDILNPLENKKDPRVEFIYNTLLELQEALLRMGSSLLIRVGKPVQVWHELIKEFNIHALYVNHDYEPYALERDNTIMNLMNKSGIAFKSYKDQVIFEKDEILKQDGTPYTVYTPYSLKWNNLLSTNDILPFPIKNYSHYFLPTQAFPIPTLEAIDFQRSGYTFPGKSLPKEIVRKYDKQRDYPAINGTTRLSVHLRFGTLSIRSLVRSAMELNETWLGELIWREFFMMILYHFPYVVDRPFKQRYQRIKWRNDRAEFERWCNGETGYPMVDAGMRELNQTGFMHNRVRMITASFLTKHLLIDWRWGERYFAQKLLDYELSSNNGNWQWAAGCGCDAAPYFRIFNPTTQLKKFDPDLAYVRKWIPELDSPQYPKAMVDHTMARERALSVLSAIH